jgi:hypothetical protein
MLTIFSIPKPFDGPIGVIQRNALASWRRLAPGVEIILFGADAGVAEAAQEFGAIHQRSIEVNRHGTPLVSDAFARAQAMASHPVLMYSNADMLYDETLLAAFRVVQALPNFLMSGRRWDLDVTSDLRPGSDETWRDLFAGHAKSGKLHGPAGMDYFVFPRGLPLKMPPLAVGRVGWDGWMVWKCRSEGIPVIDATRTVVALHQNHDYAHLSLENQPQRGPERDLNLGAAGGLAHMLTLREANRQMVAGALTNPPWLRRPLVWLAPTTLYQKLLALKRSLA